MPAAANDIVLIPEVTGREKYWIGTQGHEWDEINARVQDVEFRDDNSLGADLLITGDFEADDITAHQFLLQRESAAHDGNIVFRDHNGTNRAVIALAGNSAGATIENDLNIRPAVHDTETLHLGSVGNRWNEVEINARTLDINALTVTGLTRTLTDRIYRRSSSRPGTPSGGTTDQNHLPSGWSRTEPTATSSQGVWESIRTLTFSVGNFVSATAWQLPTETQPRDTVPRFRSIPNLTGRYFGQAILISNIMSARGNDPHSFSFDVNDLGLLVDESDANEDITGNTGFSPGTFNHTVRVTDADGDTDTEAFSVTVIDIPAWTGFINDIPLGTERITPGGTIWTGLAASDVASRVVRETGFSITSSNPSVSTATITNAGLVIFTHRSPGTTTFTITATNPSGSADTSFNVTVVAS